jgi:hypothetical protein
MPEPSLTSLLQKTHFFGTYISGYHTATFRLPFETWDIKTVPGTTPNPAHVP